MRTTNRYSLRLYDKELAVFDLRHGVLGDLTADILSVDGRARHLLPLDLEVSGEGVARWLERRVIPKNRAFVSEILGALGLGTNDVKGIIDVCKGLSLNDSYWVVPYGFDGRFGDFNLFENGFSEDLSLVAFTGAGGGERAFTTSPEPTTNGVLPKAWRRLPDGIWLYKGGSSGAANTGKEPYSEYYACQVAEAMGLDCVSYGLERWKGILASKCRLFTDIDTSFVPMGRIVKTGGLKACLDYHRKISPEAAEAFKNMLVFDAVICNEDRHYGNFGVLRDNRSGEVVGAAPIFDNGFSLFCLAMPDDLDNLEEYARTRTNPYYTPYDTICRAVMGPAQRARLRHLVGFEFKRHPSINLPEPRLKAIEKQIRRRTRELLGLAGQTF